MKKVILAAFIFLLGVALMGCSNYFAEREGKNITESYYQALIDEDYEKAFEQLYLYDFVEDKHATEGTTLTKKETKEFYMKKINYLKEQGYKVKDFEIENIKYEDGHTFFIEIKLDVEQDGQNFEWLETVDIWRGKVWVIERGDPFAKYRDGKMNF